MLVGLHQDEMARSQHQSELPLAALVAFRMRELSLTQAELADRMRRLSRGAARPTRANICHWCRGDVTPGSTSVRWLAAALEMDLAMISMLADAQRDGGDVERRRFLVGMAATMTTAAAGVPPGQSVGQRVFESIAKDDSELLSTVQTTHATDWEISRYVLRDGAAAAALAAWLRDESSPVLRVNAAGILAKLGVPSVTKNVIASLRRDDEARLLYCTAVVNRVLRLPWDSAAERVATVTRGGHYASWTTDDEAARLAAEAHEGRDSAARWCSSILLGV
jgi:transcriptional regulator with XRE-family HTH domain